MVDALWNLTLGLQYSIDQLPTEHVRNEGKPAGKAKNEAIRKANLQLGPGFIARSAR